MTTTAENVWQPHLEGKLIKLRPLAEIDFEQLYAVGSDPELWAQHPERDRYKHEKFSRFFQSGIDSHGAFAIFDLENGKMTGTSRYTGHDANQSIVEVVYTFLARSCWGKGYNSELKKLMLDHAFTIVDTVQFYIGEDNLRSRRAVEKLGAKLVCTEPRTPLQGAMYTSVIYEISRRSWTQRTLAT
jgi:RimJ/RimL family protein N-acetyltransferase